MAPRPGSGSWGLPVLEQLAGDDRTLYLGGALVDARGADVSVEVLEQVAALEGAGTMQLQALVDDPLGRLSSEQLGHCGRPGDVAARSAGVVGPGRGVHEPAGGLQSSGQVGQRVADRLQCREWAAVHLTR